MTTQAKGGGIQFLREIEQWHQARERGSFEMQGGENTAVSHRQLQGRQPERPANSAWQKAKGYVWRLTDGQSNEIAVNLFTV